jgi:tRNA-splicing ligase RtcB
MLNRLAKSDGVVHIAVMPDAHVAEDVCVGTVTATLDRLLPAAVGSDIGCGMLSVGFDVEAAALDDRGAATILSSLYERVPCHRHPMREAPALPRALAETPLSTTGLESAKRREARSEMGTLGRGNHFLELQRDEEGRLWLMLHSGSRAMGPMIRRHHEAKVARDRNLAALAAESEEGSSYLADLGWAIDYAKANRDRMLEVVVHILSEVLGARPDESTRIEADHNHVRCEEHEGRKLWVHRKGALGLPAGAIGVVPGSMGRSSFHVEGRGTEAALCSCAHGAGRAMSRSEARRRITVRKFERETQGIWFDRRMTRHLIEEAPSAYKDVGVVLRAQQGLVRIVRRLEPVLVYKGV